MKGRLFLIVMFVLIFTVSVSAQGPETSPLPTDTPLPATDTPSPPTDTPSPTPTVTPTVTPTPPIEPPPLPPVDVSGIEDYVGAVGIGAVVTVIVEILKRLGVIPDGQAGRWATLANVVVFGVLALLGVFGVEYDGDAARAIYDLLDRIGQAVLMIVSSPLFFKFLREANVFTQMRDRSGPRAIK